MPSKILVLRAAVDAGSHPDSPCEDWPTTMRFSRRLGEAVRDPGYAFAIEGPDGSPRRQAGAGGGFVRCVARLIGRMAALSAHRES